MCVYINIYTYIHIGIGIHIKLEPELLTAIICNTLGSNKQSCKLEESNEHNNDCYKILFDFETITSGKTHEPCNSNVMAI